MSSTVAIDCATFLSRGQNAITTTQFDSFNISLHNDIRMLLTMQNLSHATATVIAAGKVHTSTLQFFNA